MELTLRQRIFLGTGLIALLIIAIVLGLLYMGRKKGTPTPGVINTETPTTQNVVPDSLVQKPGTVTQPVSKPATFSNEAPKDRFARQVASMFVERFETSSNQNNNEHIDAVLGLVTQNMVKWLGTQGVPYGTSYAGVTTDVIASSLLSLTDTKASVHVETEQRFSGAAGTETKQRKGRVDLVWQDNTWKVDGFYWDK